MCVWGCTCSPQKYELKGIAGGHGLGGIRGHIIHFGCPNMDNEGMGSGATMLKEPGEIMRVPVCTCV